MLGKSVDFSARTLITPDPNINMMNWEYHGVFDLDLKYLETVTPYNIEVNQFVFIDKCYLITVLSLIICS